MNFIILNVLVSILELIFIVSNVKIEFLPNYIFIIGFNLLQIYMLLYIFSRFEKRLFNLTKSAYFVLIALVIFMFMPFPKDFGDIFINLSYIIFVLETYIFLNCYDKRFLRLTSWVFTIICLLQFTGDLIVKFMWFFWIVL